MKKSSTYKLKTMKRIWIAPDPKFKEKKQQLTPRTINGKRDISSGEDASSGVFVH